MLSTSVAGKNLGGTGNMLEARKSIPPKIFRTAPPARWMQSSLWVLISPTTRGQQRPKVVAEQSGQEGILPVFKMLLSSCETWLHLHLLLCASFIICNIKITCINCVFCHMLTLLFALCVSLLTLMYLNRKHCVTSRSHLSQIQNNHKTRYSNNEKHHYLQFSDS